MIQTIPRKAPLLFLGTAHVALPLAFGLAAWWLRVVAGFFYHSWMTALVHLVTRESRTHRALIVVSAPSLPTHRIEGRLAVPADDARPG